MKLKTVPDIFYDVILVNVTKFMNDYSNLWYHFDFATIFPIFLLIWNVIETNSILFY